VGGPQTQSMRALDPGRLFPVMYLLMLMPVVPGGMLMPRLFLAARRSSWMLRRVKRAGRLRMVGRWVMCLLMHS